MTSHPLVMIEWEDSAQPIAAWSYLASFDSLDVVKCISVGWLIHDGADVKALAQNMGNVQDEDSAQVSGVMRIPTRCIVSVHHLRNTQMNGAPTSTGSAPCPGPG